MVRGAGWSKEGVLANNRTSISHLSQEGKKIFRAIVGEYQIDDVAGLRVLRVACEAFDRAQAAREAIDADGMTVLDKAGQRKPHPLISCERDARNGFLAGLKALSLDLNPLRDGPGRPPGTKNKRR
jgi:phage terminase small subunit